MKKYLIILIALTLNSSIIGQNVNFDDSLNSPFVIIDTAFNPTNIWQIGQPQKTLFDSAYSRPNALLTDTLNNYPTNDTSAFYLWHTSHNLQWYWPTLSFYFKVDSDSLNDFGTIEVSADRGLNWINVTSESNTYGFSWNIFNRTNNDDWKPNYSIPFTGTTDNWRYFDLTMPSWDYTFGYTDSILFRFSFISDGIETNQNGWVIDQISMGEMVQSIEELHTIIESQVYPNPSTHTVTIVLENANSINFDLTITDEKGQVVMQKPNIKQSEIKLNITELRSGIYFYQLSSINSDKQARGTFVKN